METPCFSAALLIPSTHRYAAEVLPMNSANQKVAHHRKIEFEAGKPARFGWC
jgi:hypothetical protein